MRFVDVSDEVKKKLKKFKSDKAIINGYYRALEELSVAPDLTRLENVNTGSIETVPNHLCTKFA